ncbi:divalent cation tolerance protein CutA [Ferrimicrobium sp.]|uniref:divalent cation tolerance protein CutA n=1 Tax=Ferrimicrobium sp. TaxID=2926050 RepID=UPI002615F9B1|nr:divalent cation tolerance protein CutA [Ferrimicrobium sp.]
MDEPLFFRVVRGDRAVSTYHGYVSEEISLPVFEVQTTTDEATVSLALRDQLVASNLTPCVKIQAGCQSKYYWNGSWQNADEYVITALTLETHLGHLVSIIKSAHNYVNPEVIARPIVVLSKEYADWVQDVLLELQAGRS